jgi:voltage-gated potassium channel Kch
LYGFSYFEAGKNVIQLFQNKGWTVIITDDLADNVLFMVSVGVGMVTGLIGLAMAAADPSLLAALELEDSTTQAGFM